MKKMKYVEGGVIRPMFPRCEIQNTLYGVEGSSNPYPQIWNGGKPICKIAGIRLSNYFKADIIYPGKLSRRGLYVGFKWQLYQSAT